jgi:hypothetical protein
LAPFRNLVVKNVQFGGNIGRHNDTQHNDVQHNNKLNKTLSLILACCQSAVMPSFVYAKRQLS